MKVLVSGGAGFIGANLVHKLVKNKQAVHVLQKETSDPWRLRELKDKIVYHKVSLLDKEKLIFITQSIKPEVIYHLAAYGAYADQKDPELAVETNIVGTLNLLEATKDISYRAFVNTGSSLEYGIKNKPMREDDFCSPVSFYAASKLSSTVLCAVFARTYNKPIVTLRLFSAYGPYEEKRRFIPTIINSVLERKKIKLTKKEIRHDFVFIIDVIEAYLIAAEKATGLSGRIFNIGTGLEYTNREIVEMIFAINGRKVSIEKSAYPARSWDNKHWVADNTHVRKLLGWEPKYSIEQGLKKTYSWYKDRFLFTHR